MECSIGYYAGCYSVWRLLDSFLKSRACKGKEVLYCTWFESGLLCRLFSFGVCPDSSLVGFRRVGGKVPTTQTLKGWLKICYGNEGAVKKKRKHFSNRFGYLRKISENHSCHHSNLIFLNRHFITSMQKRQALTLEKNSGNCCTHRQSVTERKRLTHYLGKKRYSRTF